MLSSVEQAFVGREEIRAPLKTPAWEAKEVLVFGVPPTGLSVQVTCQANSAFVNSGKPLFTYSVFAVTNVSKMIALWQAYLARLSRFNPTSPTLFVFLC